MTITEIDILEVSLVHGVCIVTFEKKDGSIRTMKCTKKMDLIPKDRLPKGDTSKPRAEGIMTVWDLDKEDWRSFVRDNVKGWKTL